MKARREHRVPLSGRAVEVLTEAREFSRGAGLVFPSKRAGKPLSDMAFTALLRRLNIDAVPHGFRSTFKTGPSSKPLHLGLSARRAGAQPRE